MKDRVSLQDYGDIELVIANCHYNLKRGGFTTWRVFFRFDDRRNAVESSFSKINHVTFVSSFLFAAYELR